MPKSLAFVIGALFTATLLIGVPTRSAQAQSPDPDGGDLVPAMLTVTKVCPTGNGGSDADFNILVMKDEAGIAAAALECNEALTVQGLVAGVYRISELITGPDAASFAATLACLDAAGQLITLDANGDVIVDAGSVKQCAVINLFNAPPPASDETDDGTSDGTNVSTSTHSNSSRYTAGGLDNYNVEHNSNTTTNSQEEQNDTSSNNSNDE